MNQLGNFEIVGKSCGAREISPNESGSLDTGTSQSIITIFNSSLYGGFYIW